MLGLRSCTDMGQAWCPFDLQRQSGRRANTHDSLEQGASIKTIPYNLLPITHQRFKLIL